MTRPDSNIPLSIDFALIALALSILTPPTSDAALMHANACAARGVVVCARCTAIGTEGQAARRCNYMHVYWWQLVSAHSSHYLPSKTAAATHWHGKRYDSANDAGIRQPPKCQLPSMKRASAPRWRNTLYPQKNLSPLALSVKCAQAGGVVADDCSNCEIRCALHSADMPRHQISATSERSERRGWCGVQAVQTHSSAWRTCAPGDVRWDTHNAKYEWYDDRAVVSVSIIKCCAKYVATCVRDKNAQ